MMINSSAWVKKKGKRKHHDKKGKGRHKCEGKILKE